MHESMIRSMRSNDMTALVTCHGILGGGYIVV